MPRQQKEKKRCQWAEKEIFHHYHDTEWCVPVHDDRVHYEFLLLEGAQAGLSWEIILKKRENYRKAFDRFDYTKIARYTQAKERELLKNEGIVRNRLKIASAISNAQAFLAVRKEFGTFDAYIWSFTKGKQIRNTVRRGSDMPSSTPLSDAVSKDLRKRGFRFVGTTIIYSYLQAIGVVNDHETRCAWR